MSYLDRRQIETFGSTRLKMNLGCLNCGHNCCGKFCTDECENEYESMADPISFQQFQQLK